MKFLKSFLLATLMLGTVGSSIATIAVDKPTGVQIIHAPTINFGAHSDDDTNSNYDHSYQVNDHNHEITQDDTSLVVHTDLNTGFTIKLAITNLKAKDGSMIDWAAVVFKGIRAKTVDENGVETKQQITTVPKELEVTPEGATTLVTVPAGEGLGTTIIDFKTAEIVLDTPNVEHVDAKNYQMKIDVTATDSTVAEAPVPVVPPIVNEPTDKTPEISDNNEPPVETPATPDLDEPKPKPDPPIEQKLTIDTIAGNSTTDGADHTTADNTPEITGHATPGSTVTVTVTGINHTADIGPQLKLMKKDSNTEKTTLFSQQNIPVNDQGVWILDNGYYLQQEKQLQPNLYNPDESATNANNLKYTVSASEDKTTNNTAETSFKLLGLGTVIDGPGTSNYQGKNLYTANDGTSSTDDDGDNYDDVNHVDINSLNGSTDQYMVMKYAKDLKNTTKSQTLNGDNAQYALIMKQNPIALQYYNGNIQAETYTPKDGGKGIMHPAEAVAASREYDASATGSLYLKYTDSAIYKTVTEWWNSLSNSAKNEWFDQYTFARVNLNGYGYDYDNIQYGDENGLSTQLSSYLSNPTTDPTNTMPYAFIPSEADLKGTPSTSGPYHNSTIMDTFNPYHDENNQSFDGYDIATVDVENDRIYSSSNPFNSLWNNFVDKKGFDESNSNEVENRDDEVDTLVIDTGSGMCKAGFADGAPDGAGLLTNIYMSSLRSPRGVKKYPTNKTQVSFLHFMGIISDTNSGNLGTNPVIGVRPAFWIKIN